ncbi:MAG: glycerophosphodiester phosphodiesterase [Deltaproteobacteria bacterium]|nr:glycerophosphodiester phosphodiesterase [Deltaproteobacteria bacterium]
MRGVDRVVRTYPRAPGRPLVFGHRGASARAPENTIESFQLAQAEGADGVELDVMVCGSGEVVVCHDLWLDRLANAHVCVVEASLAELRTHNVAAYMPAWRPRAQIPILEEVLEALPSLRVNIELKDSRWVDGGLARKVARIVKDLRAEDRVVLSSFNPLELVRARLFSPTLPQGFLYEQDGPVWAQGALIGPLSLAQAVHPEHVLIDEMRVRAWHAAGFAVWTWTVDEPARARTLASWGVDGIITNTPRELLQVLAG